MFLRLKEGDVYMLSNSVQHISNCMWFLTLYDTVVKQNGEED